MLSDSKNNMDMAWSMCFAFIAAAFVIIMPELAAAQATIIEDDDVADRTGQVAAVICNIIKALQGPVARGVAAFGIIFLGFSLFLGKISWGTALALGIGLGAIFGAEQLVNLMAGGAGDGACGAID